MSKIYGLPFYILQFLIILVIIISLNEVNMVQQPLESDFSEKKLSVINCFN